MSKWKNMDGRAETWFGSPIGIDFTRTIHRIISLFSVRLRSVPANGVGPSVYTLLCMTILRVVPSRLGFNPTCS